MDAKMIDQIVDAVGGTDNICSVVHCATRLRFSLRDEKKADDAKAQSIPGVLSLVKKGGQYQLVIGNDVDLVYDALIQKYPQLQKDQAAKPATPAKKKGIVNAVLGAITGSIAPVVPLLAGCGMARSCCSFSS